MIFSVASNPNVPKDADLKLFKFQICFKKIQTEVLPLVPVTAVIIFGCLLKKIEATKARALLTFFDLDNGNCFEFL